MLFSKNDVDEIHFVTVQELELPIRRPRNEIVMEFPIYGLEPATASKVLLDALGIRDIVHCAYNRETKILLLEISSTEILAQLSPDFRALIKSHDLINGVLVTARSESDNFDFHSRYFWPWSGTDEDPVTGGTHTFLAKYWGDKLNRKKMRSFQASKRSGYMDIELVDETRLLIKSEAVIVLEGEIVL